MSISRAALLNAGQHDVAALVGAAGFAPAVIAARQDRGDDALRAAGGEKAGRIVGRVKERQAHRDDVVLHLFEAVERTLATQRVLGEKLQECVASERGDFVVGLEDVERNAAAAPFDVVGGQGLHAREDLVAGKADGREGAAHGVAVVRRVNALAKAQVPCSLPEA